MAEKSVLLDGFNGLMDAGNLKIIKPINLIDY